MLSLSVNMFLLCLFLGNSLSCSSGLRTSWDIRSLAELLRLFPPAQHRKRETAANWRWKLVSSAPFIQEKKGPFCAVFVAEARLFCGTSLSSDLSVS